MKTLFAIRVIFLFLFAMAAQQAPAQSLGSLNGEVTSGAQIRDSRWFVEVRPLQESRSGPPDRAFLATDGRFHFSGLKAGSYELVVMDPN